MAGTWPAFVPQQLHGGAWGGHGADGCVSTQDCLVRVAVAVPNTENGDPVYIIGQIKDIIERVRENGEARMYDITTGGVRTNRWREPFAAPLALLLLVGSPLAALLTSCCSGQVPGSQARPQLKDL